MTRPDTTSTAWQATAHFDRQKLQFQWETTLPTTNCKICWLLRAISYNPSKEQWSTNSNIDSTYEKRPDRPSQWGDFSKAQVSPWWTDEWAIGQWTGAWVQGSRIRRMRVSLRLAITGPPAAAPSSISSLTQLVPKHFVFVFVFWRRRACSIQFHCC